MSLIRADPPKSVESMHGVTQNEKMLVFRVGLVSCCVPVRDVESILSPVKLSTFPGQACSIAGVFHHRSKAVSVVDLRIKFGLQKVAEQEGRFVMATTNVGLTGFWVDEILEITEAQEQNWQQAPNFVSGKMFGKTLLLDGKLILSTDFQRLYDMENAEPLTSWVKESPHEKDVLSQTTPLKETQRTSLRESNLSKANDVSVSHEGHGSSSIVNNAIKVVETKRLPNSDRKQTELTLINSNKDSVVRVNQTKKSNDKVSSLAPHHKDKIKENYISSTVGEGRFKKTPSNDLLLTKKQATSLSRVEKRLSQNNSKESNVENQHPVDRVEEVIENRVVVIIPSVLPVVKDPPVTTEYNRPAPPKKGHMTWLLALTAVVFVSVMLIYFWPTLKTHVANMSLDILSIDEYVSSEVQIVPPPAETEDDLGSESIELTTIGAIGLKNELVELPTIEVLVDQSSADEKIDIPSQEHKILQANPNFLALKKHAKINTVFEKPVAKTPHSYVLPIIPEWGMYSVVKGDTLWAISIRFYQTPYRYPDLARWSVINNPDLIHPNEIIIYQMK